MADDDSIWGTVVKYVVLPIALIALAYYAIKLLFGDSGKIIEETAKQIETIWEEYDKELKEFLENDGTIDEDERELLLKKLDLLEEPLENLSKAIKNPLEIAEVLGTFAIICITLYYTYKWTAGKLGPKLAEYLTKVKANVSKPDPKADYNFVVQNTIQELQVMFEVSTIMSIADEGNLGLASSALAAHESYYFSDLIPQMQLAYNTIVAQLPYLVGMQLAVAQFMLTQYNYYVMYYSALPPPIITIAPPLF